MKTLGLLAGIVCIVTLVSWVSAGQMDQMDYSRIRNGMTEDEVRSICGPPDKVHETIVIHRRTKYAIGNRRVYIYYDPDSYQKIETKIYFQNGIVFGKERSY